MPINSKNYAKHMEEIHFLDSTKCPICHKIYTISYLSKHIKTHANIQTNQSQLSINLNEHVQPDIDFEPDNPDPQPENLYSFLGIYLIFMLYNYN